MGSRGVILDSNFLFVPLRFGVDIFGELERLLGPSVVCLVPAAVLAELEVLRDGASPSLLREIDFALELAAERIAKARKAKGLTQKQLGEKLNLPQSQISRIERNPDRTTVRTLKRIARALGVDVSSLV